MPIRVAIGSLREASDETLAFAQQLGVTSIVLNTPALEGRASFGSGALGKRYWEQDTDSRPEKWDFLELTQLRNRIEDHGLVLAAIENTPIWFYDKIMLGLEGRERQLDAYLETVRALGEAGIPMLGYHWMPARVWRTSKSRPGRGGTRVNAFDLADAENAPPMFGRVYGESEMWEHYEYFIKAVLPVAEEYGVRLALHPDDPPVPMLGGVARIFRDLEGFAHAMAIADSPMHGLDFCMGTWAEMGVERMMAGLHHFGSQGKIFYIHFRTVQGAVPRFEECFLDEGDVDLVAVIRALIAMDFDGYLIDDHVPQVAGDTLWGHRSRAFATGYIKGLVHAVEAMG